MSKEWKTLPTVVNTYPSSQAQGYEVMNHHSVSDIPVQGCGVSAVVTGSWGNRRFQRIQVGDGGCVQNHDLRIHDEGRVVPEQQPN